MSKRQGTFFDSNEMPPENWAWVVEWQVDQSIAEFLCLSERDPNVWQTVPRPNHFRLEQHAVDRVVELTKEFKRPVELKMVKFRFAAKYVGYVPPEDETWIK